MKNKKFLLGGTLLGGTPQGVVYSTNPDFEFNFAIFLIKLISHIPIKFKLLGKFSLRHLPANRRHKQAPGAVDAEPMVAGCDASWCDVRHILQQRGLVLRNCNKLHFYGVDMACQA